MLSHKLDIHIIFIPSRLLWKRKWKDQKIQERSVCELVVIVIAYTQLAQAQYRPNSHMESGRGDHGIPPLAKKISAIDSFQKESVFFQDVAPERLLMLQQIVSYPCALRQQKMDSVDLGEKHVNTGEKCNGKIGKTVEGVECWNAGRFDQNPLYMQEILEHYKNSIWFL